MEDDKDSVEVLFKQAEAYGKTTVELLKLQAIHKSADVISAAAAAIAVTVLAVLAILSVNFGLALWIGELINKTYLGFLLVGGFYIIATALLYIFRNRWIKAPLYNAIIHKIWK